MSVASSSSHLILGNSGVFNESPSSIFNNVIWQVDYPDVVKIKKSFIKNEPSLYSAIGTENQSCPGVEGEFNGANMLTAFTISLNFYYCVFLQVCIQINTHLLDVI